jgi:hypothetical protein
VDVGERILSVDTDSTGSLVVATTANGYAVAYRMHPLRPARRLERIRGEGPIAVAPDGSAYVVGDIIRRPPTDLLFPMWPPTSSPVQLVTNDLRVNEFGVLGLQISSAIEIWDTVGGQLLWHRDVADMLREGFGVSVDGRRVIAASREARTRSGSRKRLAAGARRPVRATCTRVCEALPRGENAVDRCWKQPAAKADGAQ